MIFALRRGPGGPVSNRSGNNHDIEASRKPGIHDPEALPDSSADAISLHGVAHPFSNAQAQPAPLQAVGGDIHNQPGASRAAFVGEYAGEVSPTQQPVTPPKSTIDLICIAGRVHTSPRPLGRILGHPNKTSVAPVLFKRLILQVVRGVDWEISVDLSTVGATL